MIVKKMPILQGFPDFETVKNLSGELFFAEDFSPVFYDIETTGLGRNSTFLYLIGAVCREETGWQLYQWLGAGAEEEKMVLEAFVDFVTNFTCVISYNGEQFDAPYLEARLKVHNLASPFPGKSSLDLYKALKPLKGLLKLPGMKQPQMEAFLGAQDRIFCDGAQCIRLYRKYVSCRDEQAMEAVLGHNREDLLGLGRVFEMLSYLCLARRDYTCTDAEFDGGTLILQAEAPCPFPAAFSNKAGEFYITGKDRTVKVAVKAANGRVRQYYANYRNYDYLPAEDMAIPKSLGQFMDKSLRVRATRDTCYTWFDCTREFLADREKQKDYMGHCMEYLIWKLK